MNWKDIGDVVGKVAPIVGTAIGGPAGAAVGALVSGLLGVDNTPDAVAKAIKANPDLALKLKTLEFQAHQLDVDARLKEEQMRLTDVQAARTRQIDHEKVTGKTDTNLYVLMWMVVLGFFALIGILLFVEVPSGSTNIIYMLFGTLSAGFGSVMQYNFGSSKGSKDKTLLLHKMKSNIEPAKEEKY